MVDRIVRKSEAARLLGVSLTSLWRLETLGLIRAVSVLPGLAGFKESELSAFVDSRERAEPNRARVEAALASPRHGRAGRTARAAEPGERNEGERAERLTMSQAPKDCPVCGSSVATSAGVCSCADAHGLACDWSARVSLDAQGAEA